MFKKQCIFINNCLIYSVATECTHTLNGKEYTGTVSHTKTGKPCQRWDSQTPHKHDYNHLSKDENYCRNTDGSAGPWCYTMDPDIRWELCDVPKCGKHLYNWSLHKFIHTYTIYIHIKGIGTLLVVLKFTGISLVSHCFFFLFYFRSYSKMICYQLSHNLSIIQEKNI